MRTTEKGRWLLVIVASCWLASVVLPVFAKRWVVPAADPHPGSVGLSAVLLALLFLRWSAARPLFLLYGSLHVWGGGFIFYYALRHAGPVLGIGSLLLLRLGSLLLLGCSPAIQRFLAVEDERRLP